MEIKEEPSKKHFISKHQQLLKDNNITHFVKHNIYKLLVTPKRYMNDDDELELVAEKFDLVKIVDEQYVVFHIIDDIIVERNIIVTKDDCVELDFYLKIKGI